MSLSWRDRVAVEVYPDRLVLARASGGLARRSTHREVVPVSPAEGLAARWRAPLDRLAALPSELLAKSDVSVVLSSFFVRYALMPWSDALANEDERQAFARHCFSRVYGADADGWAIKLSASGAGKPQVACAVEHTLVDALSTVVKAAAGRFSSLQPHLMASFNRCRRALGEADAWFVDVEPGLASIGLLQAGAWHSLRTVKVGPAWRQELPGLLSREACLAETAVPCSQVAVFAPDDMDAPAETPGSLDRSFGVALEA